MSYFSFFIIIVINFFHRRSPLRNVFGIFPLIFLALLATISISYAPNLFESLKSVKVGLIDVVIIYIIRCNLFQNIEWAKRGLHTIAITFGTLNILAMALLITGHNAFNESVMFSETRFASFGKTANHGAYASEFFFPIFLYLFLTVKNKITKTVYAIFIITCISAISLTGSRGGYIGFILQILLLILMNRRYRGNKQIIIFIIIALTGIYISMGELLIENLLRYQEYQGGDI